MTASASSRVGPLHLCCTREMRPYGAAHHVCEVCESVRVGARSPGAQAA